MLNIVDLKRERNKRNRWVWAVVFAFFLLYVTINFFFYQWDFFKRVPEIFWITNSLALLWSLSGWFCELISVCSGYVKVEAAEQNEKLWRAFNEIKPDDMQIDLYFLPRNKQQAQAGFRLSGRKFIVATDGLVNTLSDDELKAVLAHEISHLRNKDVLISFFVDIFKSSIEVILTLFFYIGMIILFKAWFNMSLDDYPLLFCIFFITIFWNRLIVFLFLSLEVFLLWQKEYVADLDAAIYSQESDSLASGLMSLTESNRDDLSSNLSFKTIILFYFLALFDPGIIFSSHPNTKKRVQLLLSFREDL